MAKENEHTKIYVELKSKEVIVMENSNNIKTNRYDKFCYEIDKQLIDNFMNTARQDNGKRYSRASITKYLKCRLEKILLKKVLTKEDGNLIIDLKEKLSKHSEELQETMSYIMKDVKSHCVNKRRDRLPKKHIERELSIRSTNHSPKKKFPRTKVDENITIDDIAKHKDTFSKNGKKYDYLPEQFKEFVATYDQIEKEFLQLQQEGLLSVYHIYKLRKKITQNIRDISYYNEVGNLENIEFIREDMKGYLIEKKEDPTPTYEYSEDEILQIFAYISRNKKLIAQQVILNRSDQIKVGKLQMKMNSIIKDLGFIGFQENMELLHNLEEEILLSSEIEQEFLNQKIDDESSTQ